MTLTAKREANGYWEWMAFKKPAHPDRLGYWAWRGGALGYTETKPSIKQAAA